MEEFLGLLVNIEYSDEGTYGGGLVTATRLRHQSWGAIIMRITLLEVPGLFSPSSYDVHDVMIRFQHLSEINVVFAKVTGGGDHVDCSRLLNNIFPYDDGTSLPNEYSVALSTMEENDEDDGLEGALVNYKSDTYQLEFIYEALVDETRRPYCWCKNIAGLKFTPP